MHTFKKKMLTGIIAGSLLVAGGLGCYYVQAASVSGENPGMTDGRGRPTGQPPRMDSAKSAEHVAEVFGVSYDEVKKAIDDGVDFRSIGQAAMMAKLSSKSFAEVMALKTEDNDWCDVQELLGVTDEQVQGAMNVFLAGRMSERGNIDKDTALHFLQNGYEARDIEAAAYLSGKTGKDMQAILDMKKINNKWPDVAKSLGVDWKGFEDQNHPKGMEENMAPAGMRVF